MRADIASPCNPSLPNGTPNTPSTPTPHLGRRRKQSNNSLRVRSSGLGGAFGVMATGGGGQGGSRGPLMVVPHPDLATAQSTTQQQFPVSDPQSLQEKKELLEYFQKLRVLVPSLPKTGRIPKLDVIEHVITYIRQLENQLIDHPMIQVLENNAYISGLLQSMAPEFDISHLLLARALSSSSSHQQQSPSTMGAPAGPGSTGRTDTPLTASWSESPRILESSLEFGGDGAPVSQRSAHRQNKAKRSSLRKPLGLLTSSHPHK